MSRRLWCLVRAIACTWQGDSQEVEGLNSMLQAIVQASAAIKLPLLDARLGIRKTSKLGQRGKQHTKWSSIAALCEALIEEALKHLAAVPAILATPGRFAKPNPCARTITRVPHLPALTPIQELPALIWASGWHKKLVDAQRQSGADCIIMPLADGADCPADSVSGSGCGGGTGSTSGSSSTALANVNVGPDSGEVRIGPQGEIQIVNVGTDTIAVRVDSDWPSWGLMSGRECFLEMDRYKGSGYFHRGVVSFKYDAAGRRFRSVRRTSDALVSSLTVVSKLYGRVQASGGATVQMWSLDWGGCDEEDRDMCNALVVPTGTAPAPRNDRGEVELELDITTPVLLTLLDKVPVPKRKRKQQEALLDVDAEEEPKAVVDAEEELEEPQPDLAQLLHPDVGARSDDDDSDLDSEHSGPLFTIEDAEAERELQEQEVRMSRLTLQRNRKLGEILEENASRLAPQGIGLVDAMTEALSSLHIAAGLEAGEDDADDRDAPPAEPVNTTVEALLAAWRVGLLAGKEALDDRKRTWNAVLEPRIQGRQQGIALRDRKEQVDIEDEQTFGKMWKALSLVQLEQQLVDVEEEEEQTASAHVVVRFVRWVVGGRKGWVVPIEFEEGAWRPRPKPVNPRATEQREEVFNQETTIIIHPNTRVTQAAAFPRLPGQRDGLRVAIPAHIMRLKTMWETSLRSTESALDDAESAPLRVCGFCSTFQARGTWPVNTCPVCLTTFHEPCAARLCEEAGRLLDSDDQLRDAAQLDIPGPLQRLLCRLCQQVMARRVDELPPGEDEDEEDDDDNDSPNPAPKKKAKAKAKAKVKSKAKAKAKKVKSKAKAKAEASSSSAKPSESDQLQSPAPE